MRIGPLVVLLALVVSAGAVPQDTLTRLEHTHPQQREAAAWDLGVTAEPASVGALEAALTDPDPGVRRGAAWALSEIATPEALAAVYGLLVTSDEDAARFALRLLETSHEETVQPLLLRALEEHPSSAIRLRTLTLLDQHFTPEMLTAFQDIAEGSDDALKVRALPILVKHRLLSESDDLIPTFVRFLRHPDPAVREDAIRGLRGFQDEAVRELLEDAIADPDPEVHEAALSALASMVDELSLPQLVRLYDAGTGPDRATIIGSVSLDRRELMQPIYERALIDPHPEPRRCLMGIASFNYDPWVIPVLRKGASDPEASIRRHAAGELARQADAPRDILLRLVRDEAPFVRASLLEALAKNCQPAAPEIVTAAAGDPEAEVRLLAIAAMPACLDWDARIAALESLLGDEAPGVRAAALRSLGRFTADERSTIEAARSSLNDGAGEVRAAAVEVIGRGKKRGWIEALGAALQDSSPDVRREAVEWLKLEDNDTVRGHLVTALKDADVLVRRAAIVGVQPKGPAMLAQLEELRQHDPDMLVQSYAEIALRHVGAYSGPASSPFTEDQLPARFAPLFVFPGSLPDDLAQREPNPAILGRYTATDPANTPELFHEIIFERDDAGRLFCTSWGLRQEFLTEGRFVADVEFPGGRSVGFWDEDGGFYTLGWSRGRQYESFSVVSYVPEGDTLVYTQRTETRMPQDPMLASLEATFGGDQKKLADYAKKMGLSPGPKTQYYEATYQFRRAQP